MDSVFVVVALFFFSEIKEDSLVFAELVDL